ncbi:MAG: hypothetical protein KAT38_12840, partial [Bacteroidales bacterium]|nr:hypothetical protein [Bacteroidales bacterium]
MKLYKSLIFVMCLVLFTVVVAKGQTTVRDTVPQDDIATSAEKAALMVTSLTPKGWELYDKVIQFTPENLYEQINGRAEYYLSYDMIRMTFASFRKSTDNSIFINLSIFNMGTPSNAFGVFSGERTLEAPPLKLGQDAYRSEANYYIWKGQYY